MNKTIKEFRKMYMLSKRKLTIFISLNLLFLVCVNIGLPFKCRTIKNQLYDISVLC